MNEKLLEGIEIICHSAIRMKKNELVIYIDPFRIDEELHDADYIFCTHDHYDHFSEEDILKVKKEDSKIITVPSTEEKAIQLGFHKENIIVVFPNEEYQLKDLKFETRVAYNKTKLFHQKAKKWVGYIIQIQGVSYYITGDTDHLVELEDVSCDVLFVPVGGMYTMNAKEAANLTNHIKPKIAIPTHYGSIVGSIKDAHKFIELVNNNIQTKCFIQ